MSSYITPHFSNPYVSLSLQLKLFLLFHQLFLLILFLHILTQAAIHIPAGITISASQPEQSGGLSSSCGSRPTSQYVRSLLQRIQIVSLLFFSIQSAVESSLSVFLLCVQMNKKSFQQVYSQLRQKEEEGRQSTSSSFKLVSVSESQHSQYLQSFKSLPTEQHLCCWRECLAFSQQDAGCRLAPFYDGRKLSVWLKVQHGYVWPLNSREGLQSGSFHNNFFYY